MSFTEAEIEYLRGQPLGRLTTLDRSGAPQTRPVGAHLGPDGTVDVVGYNNASSQKWRNAERDPRVSFLVDDLISRDPWKVRGVEIRGDAEVLNGVSGTAGGMSGDVIRIHPRRILSWGVDAETMSKRDLA